LENLVTEHPSIFSFHIKEVYTPACLELQPNRVGHKNGRKSKLVLEREAFYLSRPALRIPPRFGMIF
jgi:hypothetical protein